MSDPKMPDANNVYGHIISQQGLFLVLREVRRFVAENRAFIYRSQFNGAETLHFSTDTVDFMSTPLEDGPRHLINGSVRGTPEDVVAFVRALSESLIEGGIEHRFEVYDD